MLTRLVTCGTVPSMETRICREVREFLARNPSIGVTALARLAGVSHSSLSRMLNGVRPDLMSETADNVRDAMWRYESRQKAYRQSGEED